MAYWAGTYGGIRETAAVLDKGHHTEFFLPSGLFISKNTWTVNKTPGGNSVSKVISDMEDLKTKERH